MAERYDCIVVGSGPGGYVAAIRSAQLGMRTAIVEKDRVGGRCLNYACIPAKAVLRVADVYSEVGDAAQFGITVDGASVDWKGVAKHRDKVIKTLTGGVGGLMQKNGIDVVEGHGSLTEDANVKVGGDFDGSELETAKVVLATGSVAKPVLDLKFGRRVLDTAAAWLLEEQPSRIAVIGAGASGTEIASAFGRLGTEVILLEALPQILPLEDAEIAKACAREIAKQNVEIVTEANVESAKASDDKVSLDWGDGKQDFDYLCIAAGRSADVEELGLEAAGVETDEQGSVRVDERMRTSR
ncbi:MAG TPA: FAD-dependent oxidoreductase, partial [Thermoleophilaceae bacterium]|nr:FAD-dependent oxidoreductase [Thermoleophilaceae bacterium]